MNSGNRGENAEQCCITGFFRYSCSKVIDRMVCRMFERACGNGMSDKLIAICFAVLLTLLQEIRA